jgi:predicted nucleotidyltransferase component of viral defense system
VITEGHLVRHYQGRRGGRGPAVIDIAQDHLLYHLANAGIFDLGVSLKGGTAIRKFRAGNAGRFSTDLDFAGMDDAIGYLTTPVDIVGWVRVVRQRFEFLRDLDDVETSLLRCSLANEWDVRQMIEALGREK